MQEDNALGYFVRMGITRKAVSAGSLDRGHNSFYEPPLRIEIAPFVLHKKEMLIGVSGWLMIALVLSFSADRIIVICVTAVDACR